MTIGGVLFIAFLLALVGFYIYAIHERLKNYQEIRDKKDFTILPGDGHKTWQLNMATLEMDEIEAEIYETEQGKFKRIIRKDGCLYCSALNEKNAIKHFSRMVPGRFEKIKE